MRSFDVPIGTTSAEYLLPFHSSNRIAGNLLDPRLLEAVLLEGMEVGMAVDYQVPLNK